MVKAAEGISSGKRFIERFIKPRNWEQKELGPRASLEDVAIQVVRDPTHALNPQINEIDLGRFGEMGDRMANQTLRDHPHHYEAGAVLRVKERKQGKPRLYKQLAFTTDTEFHASIALMAMRISKSIPMVLSHGTTITLQNISHQENNHVVSIYHSHAIQTPPSNADIVPILLPHKDAMCFAFVASADYEHKIPGRKYLIFRGVQTPQLPLEQAKSLLMDSDYQKNVVRTTPSNGQSLVRHVQETSSFDVQQRVQEKALFALAKQYDLQVFIAEAGENIAKKVDLDKAHAALQTT